jgi:hypothetical protein
MTDTPIHELALTGYGVEVRVHDVAGTGVCQRLKDTLPPEFAQSAEVAGVSVAYRITADADGSTEYVVACDDVAVFATDSEEELSAGSARTSTSTWRAMRRGWCSCMRELSAGAESRS